MTAGAFPFSAVVGQDDAKLALVLTAVDPRIGGVLLRGHKGSAKTTLARGLAEMLGEAPFVELPLGATEDRLVGALDTEAALTGEGFRFRPGLLAAAHGGVLYVDEINLLADHLVDTLLDVSVSGTNVVERDGMSHRHPARFVLVGSMNPEEGELRPQLLDRFGFCVEMTTPADIALRVEALRRRLAFDGSTLLTGEAGEAGEADDRAAVGCDPARVGQARPAALPGVVLDAAAGLAVEVGAEGLRADLTLCRAAAAAAGLDGRAVTGLADVRRVAPLVLAHRSRRGPFDPPTMAPEDLARALDEVLGDDDREQDESDGAGDGPGHGTDARGHDQRVDPDEHERRPEPNGPQDGNGSVDHRGQDDRAEAAGASRPDGEAGDGRDARAESEGAGGNDGDRPGDDRRSTSDRGNGNCRTDPPAGGPTNPPAAAPPAEGRPSGSSPTRPMVMGTARRAPTPATAQTTADRGRHVRDLPVDQGGAVAVAPTVRALAGRRAADPAAALQRDDLRAEAKVAPRRRTVVLCVDLSGSMGAVERAEAATGTALGLLADAYQRRDRVALVGFRGEGAEVLLSPTSSTEVARNRLDDLTTGGETPLAAGIRRGLQVATGVTAHGDDAEALLVVLTDGRATGAPDAVDAALVAAAAVRSQGVASLVLDCETGPVRLRLAEQLAAVMGARHLAADALDPAALTAAIRTAAPAR